MRTTTITDPLAHTRVVTTDLATSLVTSDQNELGKTTAYTYYSGSGLLNTVTTPEGNGATFVYDDRGNVTQRTINPKPNSGVSPIVTSATYPASDAIKAWLCASGTPTVTCNKPLTTTDALGNVTNYAWDSSTGLPTSATRPAPSAGAVRPQTRYSYSSVYAQYLSAGSLVNFATPVTRLTGVSQCQTTAGCAGTADEAKTTIGYGTANALPVSVASGSGDGALTATSSLAYDSIGNRISVDGPLSGTADTTAYRYDLDRELVGAIGPDPDGGGALKNRAVRVSYNADGQVTRNEAGTTNGQTDADWAAFATVQQVDTTYDVNARATLQKLSAGGTAYALTQASYDSLGRLDCSAVRMNIAAYGSLPASACTLGTQGSDGPDRITKVTYDAVSRPTVATIAYGTADAADEATLTYTDNGQVATLKDGENNLTTVQYDGFDRASKTLYPTKTPKGAGTSNSLDYEQLTYDPNSNIIGFRNRAAQSTGFTYDSLDRLTSKDLPGTERDSYFGYDNLGRVLYARYTGTGEGVTNNYDALGRVLNSTLDQGGIAMTTSSAWDLAGRRWRIAYPGTGLYVDYDRLVTGEISKIRENGATSGVGVFATYGYDNLGRRTAVTWGDGGVTSYGYDAVSRLTSLQHDVPGTANDLTKTFTYNPASQIVSETRSNDNYAFAGFGNVNQATVTNGLNELSTVGGVGASYDSNGNLTSDPLTAKGYGYSSENLLTSSTGGTAASLTYDPLGNLTGVDAATQRRFVYDRDRMVAEVNTSGAIVSRFVWDDGDDGPIAYLVGTDTSTPAFLHKDERGSMIILTNPAGGQWINAYDEYGQPGPNNRYDFQYTGQMWLSEIGLQYSRARMYGPGEGRFMQTDPIGYDGGVNLYAYVGNDPVNFVDPSGLDAAASAPEFTWCGDVRCTYNGTSIIVTAPALWGIDLSLLPIAGFAGGVGPVPQSPGGGSGGSGTQSTAPSVCPQRRSDPTSQNLADERTLFENIAAASDLVAVGAGAVGAFFPPVLTVAGVAKGFSEGASVVVLGIAAVQSWHTGDVRYVASAGTNLLGGAIGGRVAGRIAVGRFGQSQLRINGRFGSKAIDAYGSSVKVGGGSLGSAAMGVATCSSGQ